MGRATSLEELRQRAETLLQHESVRRAVPREADLRRLIYELEVHRVELELQNEELRNAQSEISASLDRYRELYDLAPVAHLVLDSSGRICDANLAAAALLGIERARLVGRPLGSFMTRDDADKFHLHLRHVFTSLMRQGCDLGITVGGRGIPVRIESVASSGATATRATCRAVVVDLSRVHEAEQARTKAQASSRESEARFRQIAERVDDAFLLARRDTRSVSYASPAFERIWGMPVSDLCRSGAQWLDRVHPADRERVGEAYERSLEGRPFDEAHRIQRPDGQVRWLRARAFPIAEEDGGTARDALVFQDITNERDLEEGLRHAQKMEAVGAFAAGVAHDFGNVLQAIVGCLSLARADSIPRPRADDHIDRAANAAKRGSKLVGQLTLFSYKQDVDSRPIRIDDLIEVAGALVERLVPAWITVEIELGAPGWIVVADEVQLEQMLLNLGANARDAMPGGGTLLIRTFPSDELPPHHDCRAEAHYVRLDVKDSGVGMDKPTRLRMFEPFFTTKEVGKGSGLGLSTVSALVRQLGGAIEVESGIDRGTRVSVFIPGNREAASVPAK